MSYTKIESWKMHLFVIRFFFQLVNSQFLVPAETSQHAAGHCLWFSRELLCKSVRGVPLRGGKQALTFSNETDTPHFLEVWNQLNDGQISVVAGNTQCGSDLSNLLGSLLELSKHFKLKLIENLLTWTLCWYTVLLYADRPSEHANACGSGLVYTPPGFLVMHVCPM